MGKMGKNKYLYLVIAIVMFGLLLSGGTYAWLMFNQTSIGNNIYNGIATCFAVDYNYENSDGTTELGGTLFQSSTAKGGLFGEVAMGMNSECMTCGVGTIYLKVNSGTSNILYSKVNKAHCEDPNTLKTMTGYTTSSDCTSAGYSWVNNVSALKYAVYEDIDSNPLSVGYIDGVKDITLHTGFEVNRIPRNFYVYVWLDGELADNNYLGVSFDGDIYLGAVQTEECSILDSVIKPSLDNGMIPVTIANDGTVTTILSTDSDWYDYDNKEWANVVLVSSGTRSNYQNTTGVTVNSSDILAYYVWIPRYKYKMNGTEESISIEFESVLSKSSGDATSTYLTHPAFTFGTKELAGIWVGKFETTGSSSSPTVLPNTSSLVSQKVSAQFQTGLLFSGGTLSDGSVSFLGSSTYGLDSSTDSHMMKNSEWGAVAYLSHSEYGINGQIRINNYYSSGLKTGCGASEEDADESTTCEIAYGGATSYPQSTTGNITGVFDMSGGAWEYVMGAYSYDNNVAMSGYSTSSNSGFNGIVYASGSYSEYASGVDLPPSKYYDMYKASQFTGTYSTNMTLCTLETCGGHALSETAGWYDDYSIFVGSDGPWFVRGGGYYIGAGAGAFFSDSYNGNAISDFSFRSVLVR